MGNEEMDETGKHRELDLDENKDGWSPLYFLALCPPIGMIIGMLVDHMVLGFVLGSMLGVVLYTATGESDDDELSSQEDDGRNEDWAQQR